MASRYKSIRGQKAEFNQSGPLFKIINHENPDTKTIQFPSLFNVRVYQGSKA